MFLKKVLCGLLIFLGVQVFAASSLTVKVHSLTSAKPKAIGSVVLTDTSAGLLITPHLRDLPPGVHGFHVHTSPSCADHGMAAGGHLDPNHSGKHLGPYNSKGHLGDLPVLIVDKDGTATLPILAPRLKVSEVIGHSLMIHAGGDNYSDHPEALGGGGARIACGVAQMVQNHIHARSLKSPTPH